MSENRLVYQLNLIQVPVVGNHWSIREIERKLLSAKIHFSSLIKQVYSQICISRLIMKYKNQQLLSGYWIHIQNLAHLNLTALKNLALLNGLKAIQFAVVFYDQGAIYLY
jgi:hypothetical protein